MNAVEYAPLDYGAILPQLAQQQLYLLPFALSYPVTGSRVVFGESACALEKIKVAIVFPCYDIPFMDTGKYGINTGVAQVARLQ